MANIFDSILVKKGKRNLFNNSHEHLLTCNMGELIPVMVQDCLPGDKFNMSNQAFIRFAPMVAPPMGRVTVKFYSYFVPNRILWENFPSFIYNQGTHVSPYLSGHTFDRKDLGAYLGLPSGFALPGNYSAIPFAVYQKIWNDCFRDQNLQTDLTSAITLTDGSNNALTELLNLRNKAWRHDYFTSALPTAQAGAAVSIPLGVIEFVPDSGSQGKFVLGDGTDLTSPVSPVLAGDGVIETGAPGSQANISYDPDGTLQVGATTIEDLTRAKRLQEWLNKLMRGGKRFFEGNWNFFGVRSDDARLQRPEYIYGTQSPVIISEVLNTAGTFDPANPTDPSSPPQGNMAGHGVSTVGGQNGSYYCKEHGYIMTLMCVEPQALYFQGIPRHFLRNDFTDYFFKEFAHLGEQEITIKELYADAGDPDLLFGYTPRYAEYRFQNNRISGDFRESLNFWTWARNFGTEPGLNDDFIECIPTKDPFAVVDPDTNILYCHIVNNLMANREIPKYGTPMYG